MLQFPRRVGARFVALVRADFVRSPCGLHRAPDLVGRRPRHRPHARLDHRHARPPARAVVLVPAAIGMRGNVFGALGSRLGTLIHAGTFRVSRARRHRWSVRTSAAAILSVAVDLGGARGARQGRCRDGVRASRTSISIVDFMVISVIGAILSSIVVLVITVAVAAFCARREPRPRQRRGADRHRGGRHRHAAEPVPRDLPARLPRSSRR